MNATADAPPVDWVDLADWLARHYGDVARIAPADLARRLAAESLHLVDVRTPAEQAVSTLANAVCVMPEVDARTLLASLDSERTIVVYCAVGVRSARLARALREAGAADARNLEGGIFRWANEGRPLTGPRVHGYDERWCALLRPDLRASSPRGRPPPSRRRRRA